MDKSNNASIKQFNPWLVFWVTTFGALMINLDATIVNVALPTISKYYSAELHNAQWVISGYILAACIFLLLCGKLGDIYSQKFTYLWGFVIFTISSALCGMAFSLWSLILFRFLQGMGASMMMASNQALIVLHFPKKMLGRALGINSMSAAFGALVGPALGGLLLDWLGWRSIFYINIPLGIITCIVGYHILPVAEKKQRHTLDLTGFILFAVSICCILLMFNNVVNWGWLSWKTILLFFVGFLALGLFIKYEKKIIHPLLDTSLFKSNVYSKGNIAGFIVFMALGANAIILPFYLHDQLHLTATITGLMMFVGPSVMFVLAPLCGHLTDKFHYKILVIIGLVILAFGLFCQGLLTYDSKLWEIITFQAIIGLGFALFMSPNNYSLFLSVVTAKLGIATSVNALMRTLGRVCGTVMATTIFSLLFNYFSTKAIIKTKVAALSTKAFFIGFHGVFWVMFVLILGVIYLVAKEQGVRSGLLTTSEQGVRSGLLTTSETK